MQAEHQLIREDAPLRILFVTDKWYRDIVQQLREKHRVDHIFLDLRWGIADGDYHVPKLFGKQVGFRLLSSLVAHWLLLIGAYDFCVTDYVSVFRPVIIILLRSLGFFHSTFLYTICARFR